MLGESQNESVRIAGLRTCRGVSANEKKSGGSAGDVGEVAGEAGEHDAVGAGAYARKKREEARAFS